MDLLTKSPGLHHVAETIFTNVDHEVLFLYNCKFPLISRNHNFHTLEVNNVCFPILGGKTGLFFLGLENRTSNL